MFKNAADAPLVQMPQTGVIWKISRTGNHNQDDKDHKQNDKDGKHDDD